MKKIIIPVVCLGMLLFAPGCKNSAQDENKVSSHLKGASLAEYMNSIKLPKNLSIVFDPSDVEEKAYAKAYNAEWLKLDPEKTAEHLLRYDILATGVYAEGPWIKAGDGEWTEYLNIYNGVIKGGLTYSLTNNRNDSLNNKLSCVIDPFPGFPDIIAQINKYTDKRDYDVKKDLAFLDYENAVAEAEKVLTGCGFPALAMQEVYSLDLETMSAHYQLYLEAMDKEDPVNLFQWSKQDECYLIHFRQIVDDIPLTNIIWEEGMREDWIPTETPIYVIYSKSGIINIYAVGLYEVREEVMEGELISAADALQIMLDEYTKTIQMSETKILSMELNYIGIYHGKGIQLVPAWVLCISRSVKMENMDEAVEEYTCFVINAFTGERIRRAVDDR